MSQFSVLLVVPKCQSSFIKSITVCYLLYGTGEVFFMRLKILGRKSHPFFFIFWCWGLYPSRNCQYLVEIRFVLVIISSTYYHYHLYMHFLQRIVITAIYICISPSQCYHLRMYLPPFIIIYMCTPTPYPPCCHCHIHFLSLVSSFTYTIFPFPHLHVNSSLPSLPFT